MKFKYKIKRTLNISPEVFGKKATAYLVHNSYRIIEKGAGYIIFIEDDFSDRRKSSSDFHKRIGEGKLSFRESHEGGTSVELIFLTSVVYYVVFSMIIFSFGIYIDVFIMPIVFSILLTIPILKEIMHLNEHVFKDIMEC